MKERGEKKVVDRNSGCIVMSCRPDRDRPLKAVLVATKSDLPTQRHQVADEVAVVWANNNGLEFFPVSSVGGLPNCCLTLIILSAETHITCHGLGPYPQICPSLIPHPWRPSCVVRNIDPTRCRMQVPPGKDVDAPFLALAKAFHKAYEEKVRTRGTLMLQQPLGWYSIACPIPFMHGTRCTCAPVCPPTSVQRVQHKPWVRIDLGCCTVAAGDCICGCVP